jgi:K+-sensing histidine kinase KdpD
MESSLERVYKSALKLLAPLSLDETYKIIVLEAKRLVGGDYGSIFMARDSKMERVFASSKFLETIQPRKKGFTYNVYKTKKAKVLKKKDLTKIHSELAKTGIKSDIMTPLMSRGKPIGVLTILSNKKDFNKKDLSMLRLFGPLATLAIKKAQLSDELKSALETRDLFISLASHELRTPLTVAYTYLQLEKRKIEQGKVIRKEWIDIITDELKRLNNLVDGLLQLNQINTGSLS